jgi:hypothetical protein
MQSESLNTPMGGKVASFTRDSACDSTMKEYPDAQKINWEKVKSLF